MKGLKFLLASLLIATLITAGMTLSSCKKNETSGPMTSVRMTDAPAPYAQVNVDIRGVQLISTNGAVTSLNVHTGIYNLLNFSNGLDTMIAWTTIPLGSVAQIHIILGPNNSIVLNGQTYPIPMRTGDDAGLTIDVHQTLNNGNVVLLFDFDANQSIIDDGDGQHFHLRPFLRWIDVDENHHDRDGAIKGQITPEHTLAIVTAEGNGHFYSSGELDDGEFKIRGLTAGTYTVVVTPAPPLQTKVISNVVVSADKATDIGQISF